MGIVLPSLFVVPSFFVAMLMSEASPMRKTAATIMPKITGKVNMSDNADIVMLSRKRVMD